MLGGMAMKKIKLFSLFFILFLIAGCFGNDKEENDLMELDNIKDGDRVTITGRVSSYTEGNLFFTLVDGTNPYEDSYTIFIDGDEPIVDGDYVRVSGIWLEDNNALDTEDFKVLSEEEKRAYFKQRFVYLETEIKDYPDNITHTCETPKFTLKINNEGKEKISHQQLHDENFEYAFYYFIKDEPHRMNADFEDYEKVFEEISDNHVGHSGNRGFVKFSDIAPNNSREVEYWAGGRIVPGEMGTAGMPNIFEHYSVGKIEISFGWALKNNFDPIFLFESEPVEINLLSTTCEMN